MEFNFILWESSWVWQIGQLGRAQWSAFGKFLQPFTLGSPLPARGYVEALDVVVIALCMRTLGRMWTLLSHSQTGLVYMSSIAMALKLIVFTYHFIPGCLHSGIITGLIG